MPYEIKPEGDQFCIYNVDGTKKACHPTKEDAERQLRLLHAVEEDENSGD